jgi:hypothetical protein
MQKIFKYPLQFAQKQFISIPDIPCMTFKDQVCHVDMQYHNPCVWILVDDERPLHQHIIEMYATGQEIKCPQDSYLGTFLKNQGDLVYHVYGY